MTENNKITCQMCGSQAHSIERHLKSDHEGVSIDEYKSMYPDAPIFSEAAKQAIQNERVRIHMARQAEAKVATAKVVSINGEVRNAMHAIFPIEDNAEARGASGNPIPITILGGHDYDDMIPEIDSDFVFDPEPLKNTLMALEKNIPLYFWGHAGTGKTTLPEQVAAYTRRPTLRVQHTANMEEADLIGRWIVKGSDTIFNLGPLPLAMKYGWLYVADEYDFAFPNVLAVYQAVLEGKPLLIKEADRENRMIHPHKDFRIVATGNTNGAGDETGLYQGTNLQNAANYSRFGITYQMRYMNREREVEMLMNKVKMIREDAKKLVTFATDVRRANDGGEISVTIGPRELIYAGMVGSMRGSFYQGIQLAYSNRLSKVDREVVEGIAQRHFGRS